MQLSEKLCKHCKPVQANDRPLDAIYPVTGVITVGVAAVLNVFGFIGSYRFLHAYGRIAAFAVSSALCSLIIFCTVMILHRCFQGFYRNNVKGQYVYAFLDRDGQLHVHREDPRVELDAFEFGYSTWLAFTRQRVIFKIRIGGYLKRSSVIGTAHATSWSIFSWTGKDITFTDCANGEIAGEFTSWELWMPRFLRMVHRCTLVDEFLRYERQGGIEEDEVSDIHESIRRSGSIPALRSSRIPWLPSFDEGDD